MTKRLTDEELAKMQATCRAKIHSLENTIQIIADESAEQVVTPLLKTLVDVGKDSLMLLMELQYLRTSLRIERDWLLQEAGEMKSCDPLTLSVAEQRLRKIAERLTAMLGETK